MIIHDLVLSNTPLPSQMPGVDLLEHYHTYLLALQRWFKVFLKIPVRSYIGFSFSSFSQLGECAVALYKLSTMKDPTFDVGIVRDTANLLLIGEEIANNMSRVPDLVGLDRSEGEGVFTITSKKIRSLIQRWDTKLRVAATRSHNAETTQDVNIDSVPDVAFPIDLPEDEWLTDFLASWAAG